MLVGDSVATVGLNVAFVGDTVAGTGTIVGIAVPTKVGVMVGVTTCCILLGEAVEISVTLSVGACVGGEVGMIVGKVVGTVVGSLVGLSVVGASVSTNGTGSPSKPPT